MTRFLFLCMQVVAAIGSCLQYANAQSHADLALVLAVDVSGSISEGRFHLQREGIAQALEGMSEEVGSETIELAVLEWSAKTAVIVPWTVLRSSDDLRAIAALLRTQPRTDANITDVGLGISAATDLMETVPVPADRMIIDVSGDGIQNNGDLPADKARDIAVSRGITVNGLPITEGGDADLDKWYQEHVVGGDHAFLIVANTWNDFARAMRQKLTLEVAAR